VFDRALLVLETRQRFQLHVRRLEARRDRARNLTPQHDAPLLSEKALLTVAHLPYQALEALRIERSVDALESRIVHDRLQGLFVRLTEPEPPRFFVKRGLCNGLLKHLPVDTQRADRKS